MAMRGGVIALVSLAPAWLGAQTQIKTDTIQGRIVTDSAVAVSGASINVTRAPDRAFLSTTTDSLGRFRIVFPDGTGDYLVHAAMDGYKAARQRLARKADGSMPLVTLKLASAIQKLATVEVDATKPVPDRTLGLAVGTGEAARITDGVNGMISPVMAGNLEALTLTVPGMSQVPGGISALGMGPGANAATLNGMAFTGTSLPRDAHTTTRVATSTYDPSRGGFAGAQTSVELDQGNLFSQRRSHVTMDDPSLQYGGAAGAGSNQRFRDLQLSAGGEGSVDDDKEQYNFGVQAVVRGADLSSLGSASGNELRDAGLSLSSAGKLFQALASRGISPDRSPLSSTFSNFSFIGRVDRAPYDWKTFKPSKTAWGLVGFGGVDNQNNAGLSTLTASSAGKEFRTTRGGIQALYSTFLTPDHLVDVKSSIALEDSRQIPNSLMPSGIVNVQTPATGSDSTFTTVEVGGPGTTGSSSRNLLWETIGSTEFYLGGKPGHYLRFTANARVESLRSDGGSSLGSFVYNSVGDLESNRPSEFDRVLFSPERKGSEASGFVAASDSWRVTKMFRVLYGARLEGNRFGDKPTFNQAVLDAFGSRNDNVPNSLHISPRIGFTWRLSDSRDSYMVSPLGQFRSSSLRYLRGGIGEFRNSLPAGLVSNAAANSGLPDGTSNIRCIGAATPIPDWSAFSDENSIPSDCLGGPSARSVFTDAAPRVELFSTGYSPERSWRANVGYQSKLWVFDYTIDANYSLGLSLPEYKNLNFSGATRFITDEGRPVFVSSAAIDPLTGAVSPVESRVNGNFGSVISRESLGRSKTGQLTLRLVPKLGGWRFLRGSYTLTSSSATFGGFRSTTFASPLIRETSRSDFDSRHQVLIEAGTISHGFVFTLFNRIQSGFPFTPVVNADVNGDGIANDRAFIVSPAAAAGSAVANGINALLASAPGRVRECLGRQAGHAAGRNSCDGPWTSSMTALVSSQRGLPFLKDRAHAALAFSNPLGGIDLLLHGSNSLHGWGSTTSPDPNLYIVRGFEPQTSRFVYDVNPRFGRSRTSDILNRSPFRVTLDISIDFGTPMSVQQMQRFLLPGRNGKKGPKLTAADLKKRYQRTVHDPYRDILEQSDSLLLSRDQAEAITAEHTRYLAGMDSLWTEAADKLANLPDIFDAKAALKMQEGASDAAWEYTRVSLRQSLGRLLSPLQIELAGGLAETLYKAEKPVHFRTYMF